MYTTNKCHTLRIYKYIRNLLIITKSQASQKTNVKGKNTVHFEDNIGEDDLGVRKDFLNKTRQMGRIL